MILIKNIDEKMQAALMGRKELPILQIGILLGFVLVCGYCIIPNAYAQVMDDSPLELTLSIPGGTERDFLVGERIPLNITFRNVSNAAFYIVKPIDGSTDIRYPKYTIHAQTPIPLYYAVSGRCGTLNPLREEDFVRIDAGEIKTLPSEETYLSYYPKMAGTHELSCSIDFDGPWNSYSWYYDDARTQALEPLWENVPKVAVQSATLTIQVVSSGITSDPKYHCLMGTTYQELQRVFHVSPYDEHPNITYIGDSHYLPGPLFALRVHLNENDVVDGVELVNQLEGTSLIHPSHIKLLRGDHESVNESIEYSDGYISAMRVGYFARHSGVNDEVYRTYR